MTNSEIILSRSIALMDAGLLPGSGRFVKVTDAEGNTKEFEMPEAIHTFAAWKAAGFMVKRGEHAIDSFKIWKPVNRRNAAAADEETEETAEARPGMILVKAYFFAAHQVQPITQ